jgi:TolB-like protein/Tfp pilus assembly protein PilF
MNRRLSGWKAIAAHFETTVRTVQRWEQHDNLPVQRVRRGIRDAVSADVAELDSWVRNRSRQIAPSSQPVLVVLPFSSPSVPWIGQELAAEVIHALSLFPGLRVIARTTAFTFADQPLSRICAALGAHLVVEGEITGDGSVQIRLAGADGYAIWARRYSAGPLELWAHRQDVLAAISGSLRLQLPDLEPTFQLPDPPQFLDWLRARSLFLTFDPGHVTEAVRLNRQLVDQSPSFVPALADLGAFHAQLPVLGFVPPAAALADSNHFLDRALHLAPSFADACFWKARNLALFEYRWEEAGRLYRRALTARPGHALLPYFYGADFLRTRGRYSEALSHVQQAILRDPLNPLFRIGSAQIYAALQQPDAAIHEFEEGLAIEPDVWMLRWLKGSLLLQAGRGEEAWQCLRHVQAHAPPHCWATVSYAAACLATGRRAEFDALRSACHADRSSRYVPATTPGFLAALVGDIDDALTWMETALAEKDPVLVYQPHAGNGMVIPRGVEDALRASPRWTAIVSALRLPPDGEDAP